MRKEVGTLSIRAVDLFCGVGGLTHGLARAGIDVVAGIDIDPACRYPYEANNEARFVEGDVNDLEASEVERLVGGADVSLIAGCAPCQPFSTYSRSGRSKRRGSDWQLVETFGRLVREVQPDLVTMENVPQLLDHPVFSRFVEDLSGYSVGWSVVQAARIGVPQTRKRLVLVASRLGDVGLPLSQEGKEARTVRQAIGGLRPIRAGESDPEDRLHVASRLSRVNLERIRHSKPGGTWRDWPEDLRAACHRKTSGATYPSVYGRMSWDEASPTITTQCFGYGNGRFGHPEQDRAISLREAAILQTFPPKYKFVRPDEPVRFNVLGRLIGNAVPVRLGEAVGQTLVAHAAQFTRPNHAVEAH
ncbi:DNA cytosine methyltransferase [Actinomyces sp. 2119]|uniref:Cytosine-specific methyltransferase n=1 Tax=Actinomyces lilanjuaniae TaxID=2321394 RepID=A0ABM6Z1C1_9ACTO|nr:MULTISPECIES: DNA cytosine methyltransferase [Actinomyces]AYD89027.1 DNA cytosine methyltransferase [Actinomyces lilanjuaniae]RJF40531.1 DNA cytosine methyltransferase [Actinomyces sp. 2119]RJF41809.1 DNA cytosine methyltransferase [Actinomyces sp. 2119]